jgi:hypothetical protein
MCVLALTFMTAGVFIYRALNSEPKCDCKFPNTKRYGVISAAGSCVEVPCKIGQPGK